jgi:hypothetical protein
MIKGSPGLRPFRLSRGNREESMVEEAPGQALSRPSERIEASTPGDQDCRLIRARIVNSLELRLPELSRTGEKHHLPGQISQNVVKNLPSHIDYTAI